METELKTCKQTDTSSHEQKAIGITIIYLANTTKYDHVHDHVHRTKKYTVCGKARLLQGDLIQ